MSVVRTVELFANADEHLTFRPGETIFESGTVGQLMYGIVAGSVALQVDG